jgi:hypothetical protein
MKMKNLHNAPLSPARRELAKLLEHRDAAMTEASVLNERMARLERAKADVAPIEAELNALNAAEANALLSWSESGEGDAPTNDVAKHSDIETRLATARASVRAADAATTSVAAQANRQARTLASVQPHIAQAAALVVAEEGMALLPALTAAIVAVEAIRGRIEAARMFMVQSCVGLSDEVARPIRMELENFGRQFNFASGRPAFISDISEWSSLAVALNADATATMESQS